MTFLKKLGQFLVKAAMVASGVFPVIQPFLGSGVLGQTVAKAVNDFTLIMQQVVTVETALNGKPGAEKLSALIPLVANIVKTSEVVAGKKIANEALFTTGVQEIAQGSVDILNSLHPDEVKPA